MRVPLVNCFSCIRKIMQDAFVCQAKFKNCLLKSLSFGWFKQRVNIRLINIDNLQGHGHDIDVINKVQQSGPAGRRTVLVRFRPPRVRPCNYVTESSERGNTDLSCRYITSLRYIWMYFWQLTIFTLYTLTIFYKYKWGARFFYFNICRLRPIRQTFFINVI